MACRLPKLFRQLYINGRSMSTSGHQTVNHARTSPHVIQSFLKLPNSSLSSTNESNFISSTRSIDFGFTIPPPQISKISIIDAPFSKRRHIEEPHKIIHNKEDIAPNKSIDLPTLENVIEKHAVRMIIIRRHKMKVHKLKKLRKKMKYLRMRLRAKFKVKRERAFQVEIYTKVQHAEKFQANKYVNTRLLLLTKKWLPTRWRGEILPPAMIKQFIKEHQQKKEAKKNRKRLKLD